MSQWPVTFLWSQEIEAFAHSHSTPFHLLLDVDVASLLDLVARRGFLCVLGAVDSQVFWEILAQLLDDARIDRTISSSHQTISRRFSARSSSGSHALRSARP
jgi:hypothetical protein